MNEEGNILPVEYYQHNSYKGNDGTQNPVMGAKISK
jgi:hypothetical protein